MKNVLVIGGGNIGTLIAADLSDKANVTVYSSQPDKWTSRIKVYNSDDSMQFTSSQIYVTDNLEQAIRNARFIFITLPSFMFADIANKIENYVTNEQIICIVPGSGGAEFAFKRLLDKGIKIIGFQRVHSIARLKKYGDSVYALGRKKQIELASIPSNLAKDLCSEIGELFSMPCVSLNNYLCLTLTPSNPILHTSRLYSLFSDYNAEKVYDRIPLFYGEWDNNASRVLFEMDDELQRLCDSIPLELHEVVSLKTHYESFSVQSLTDKIRSIDAFKGIYTPMKADELGYYKPDFSSRYFISDFDFGLKVICDIADACNVEVKMMKEVFNWYSKITDCKRNTFNSKIDMEYILSIYK